MLWFVDQKDGQGCACTGIVVGGNEETSNACENPRTDDVGDWTVDPAGGDYKLFTILWQELQVEC